MSHDVPHRTILVLSAPTGAGKTTIAHRLVESDESLRFSVSHTTRLPRPGEKEGVDYHFVSREEFRDMTNKGEFLEWAQVHDHYYGTHRSEAERAYVAGEDLLLDIDVQGGLQVRTADPQAVLVFILPPSLETLLHRLGGREGEEGFDLDRRLRTALKELELADSYDYNIVNEDLDKAVSQVRCLLDVARVRLNPQADVKGRLCRQIATWLRSNNVHCR
jgi:guanylate kinase